MFFTISKNFVKATYKRVNLYISHTKKIRNKLMLTNMNRKAIKNFDWQG